MRPGTRLRVTSSKVASNVFGGAVLRHEALEIVRNSEYDTPPPSRKLVTIWPSTEPSRAMIVPPRCEVVEARRPRQRGRVRGRKYEGIAGGSSSRMRPVAIAEPFPDITLVEPGDRGDPGWSAAAVRSTCQTDRYGDQC